jgi:hypothetical protein
MPMHRTVFRRIWRPVSLIVVPLWAILMPGMTRAFPVDRADPPPARQDLQAEIETVAASILSRLEAERDWNRKLSEQKQAVEELSKQVRRAENRVKSAKSEMDVYEKETYPRLLDAARSALVLARANQSREADRFRAHPTNPDHLVLQTAELRTEQVRKELEVLEGFTHGDELSKRREQVKTEEKKRQDLHDQLDCAHKALAVVERRARDASLSDLESRAILLLDRAIQLRDQGRLDPAKVTLEEATRLWRSEEARRSDSRFGETRQRIGHAAQEVRKRWPVPSP